MCVCVCVCGECVCVRVRMYVSTKAVYDRAACMHMLVARAKDACV